MSEKIHDNYVVNGDIESYLDNPLHSKNMIRVNLISESVNGSAFSLINTSNNNTCNNSTKNMIYICCICFFIICFLAVMIIILINRK